MTTHVLTQRQLTHNAARLLGALALFLAASAHADTTTLTVANATQGTSSTPVTILFPVARSGDLGYEAVLNYHTVDGSAFAGTDYTAATSSIVIPAGSTTATIPVTLSTQTGNGASLTFQLQLDSATGIGPAPNFAVQQPFATGTNPYSVTVADINGDGKPDLIVTNYLDNTVSVLLNTTVPGATTPSFANQQTFATGSIPHSVAAVDLNGDGMLDLVVANENDGTVSVLINTTAPGAKVAAFAAQQTFNAGMNPWSIVTADVNGDGRADLIVANWGSNNVSVLINTTLPGASAASFAAQQTFAVGSGPYSIVTSDLNGDGMPDVIVANQFDHGISVLLNTTVPGSTTATFSSQQTFNARQTSIAVAVGDVNGDGKPDVVVANYGDATVSVLLNNTPPGATAASFLPQNLVPAGTFPNSLVLADINGDGKLDLIVRSGAGVTVIANATPPGANTLAFLDAQNFGAGQGPTAVIAVDLNDDGKADLVVSNGSDDTVSVLLNTTASPTATLNFAAQQTFVTGPDPFSVTAADLNGDGKQDLITANCCVNNAVVVQLNTTPPGATTPSFATQQRFGAGTNFIAATSADVNGDGIPDLIVTDAAPSGRVAVLLNTTQRGSSTLSFAAQQTFATGAFPYAVTTADINGDGRPDLIVANDADNTVSVLLNTTTAGAATPTFATQQTFATGSSPYAVVIADINGDGKPDLIVANFYSNSVSVLLNTTAPGAATPSFAAQQTFATGTNPISVTAADLNGDGKPDLVVTNFGSEGTGNSISVMLNATTPGAVTVNFATQQTFGTESGPSSVTAFDLDGDGKPDLIVTNQQSSNVSVLLNTTTPVSTSASFTTQQTFATGSMPISVVATDINGDGKPDLVVSNDGGQSISVLLNTQYQVQVAGSPATGTIVHDYIFANGFE